MAGRKLCFVIFFIITTNTYPQQLSGHVLDATTGEPLIGTNVFLANTTLGCSTDQLGHFSIPHIPFGKYNLIISHMGYKLEKQGIEFYTTDPIQLTIQLQPRILEMESVGISAKEDEDWKDKYKIFEREFLGTSCYAKECKISNPYCIDLFNSSDSTFLYAKSDSLLAIENNALGYKILFLIDNFSYHYKKEMTKFCIYPVFIEYQSDNKNDLKQWSKNRESAYIGSMQHFWKTLVHKELHESDFIIRKKGIKKKGPSGIGAFQNYLPAKTLYSYVTLINVKREFYSFDCPEYPTTFYIKYGIYADESRMVIRNGPIVLGRMGNPLDNDMIFIYNGWAKLRVGDALPLNYSPVE